MNTLILNGMLSESGLSIINFLTQRLHGSYKTINLYYNNETIEETVIAEYVKKCDAVVIVSPIIFGTLSRKIIDFAAKYIGLSGEFTQKFGAVIFTCDNSDSACDTETAKRILIVLMFVRNLQMLLSVMENMKKFCRLPID